jgi:flagellar basal body-associated protein FliL
MDVNLIYTGLYILLILGLITINGFEMNYLIKNKEDLEPGSVTAGWFIIGLSLLLLIISVVVRIGQRNFSIGDLWKNKNWGLFVPLALSALIFIFSFFLKKKDVKEGTKKEKTRETFLTISLSVVFIPIFIFILYQILKKVGLDDTIIGIIIIFIVMAAVIGIGYGIWAINKPTKEDEKCNKSIYDYGLSYMDPTSREKTIKELEEILDKMGDFKMENNCKADGQSDCHYLYQQYIKSGGNNEILEKILDQLEAMDKKNNTGLINQAIFLVYQLMQCKIDLKYKTSLYKFGTLDWWHKNILMWSGNNPLQVFIYSIAVLLCFLFLLYNLGSLAYKSEDIFGGYKEGIWGFILMLMWTGSLLGSYYTYASGGKVEKKVQVESEYQKYQKGGEPDIMTTGDKWGTGLLFGNLGFLIVSLIVARVWEPMRVNVIAMLLAYVVSFNTYYMTIVPQLVILGIILQKYILSTSITQDIPATVVKVLVLIGVLFASFYDTKYTGDEKKEKGKRTIGITSAYNAPIWYIFGILVFLLLQNGFESMIGSVSQYEKNDWYLILMPALRYILDFVTGSYIKPDVLGVSNNI